MVRSARCENTIVLWLSKPFLRRFLLAAMMHLGDDEWSTTFSGFSSEVELQDVLSQCRPESRRMAERISRDATCLAYFFVRIEFTGTEADMGRMMEQVFEVARSFLASIAQSTSPDAEVVAHAVSFPNGLVDTAVPRTLVVRIHSPKYYTVGADELAWFAMQLKVYVTKRASTISKCVLDAFMASCSADADGGGTYGSLDFAPCIPLPESRFDPKVPLAGGLRYAPQPPGGQGGYATAPPQTPRRRWGVWGACCARRAGLLLRRGCAYRRRRSRFWRSATPPNAAARRVTRRRTLFRWMITTSR